MPLAHMLRTTAPMAKDHLPRPGHHQRARDHPAFTVVRCLGRALRSGADSITVTGLTAGKAYTFTVRATVGSNSGEVVVTSSPWNSDPNVGYFIYQRHTGAEWSAGLGGCSSARTQTSNATQCTASNLTAGAEYRFMVHNRPYNSFGTREYSDRATLPTGLSTASGAGTPTSDTTVPGAPSIKTVVSTMRNAVVSFNAPTSDGGSTITGYNVTTETGLGASTAGTKNRRSGPRIGRKGTATQLIPPDERWGRLAKRVGPNGSGFITVMRCSTAFGRSLRWH